MNIEGLESIVCGRPDPRVGECLRGVHHLIRPHQRTLCGRYPVDSRTAMWFSRAPVRSDEQAEGTTCKACRRAAGLSVNPWSESLVIL